MEFVTQEISSALEVLSIEKSDFQLLPDSKGKPLFDNLLDKFVIGGDRRWWWESFSLPEFCLEFDDKRAFERISNIVPSPLVPTWFVVEDDQLPFYPIYEASPADIQRVIGECYGFEYYIVPKSTAWLLCENHHNRLIGIGDDVVSKMKELNTE